MVNKIYQNGLTLLIKIWLLHYVFYYVLFGLMFHTIDYYFKNWQFDLEYLGKIFISPVAGTIGLYDGLIIIIPIIVSFLFKLRFNIFQSYYYTILLCQFGLYFITVIFSDRPSTINFTRNMDDNVLKINFLFLLIPCVCLSIYFNWIVFRKKFDVKK